jgi:formylglycine-generating enzyme required for sulfatase activity
MLMATDSTRLHQARRYLMAEQVRVFVSHHHSPEEDSFTARVVEDLKAAGADVWVDTAGIPSGSFVAKISEGLAGRQWLVLIMTPAALASPWVRAEVETGLNEYHAKRMLGVIPLVMQPCQEQDIPLLWRTLHRYDATHGYEAARDGLLQALRPDIPVHQPTPPTLSSIPVDRFPSGLAALGYQEHIIGGVEVILPPMCDVPAGPFLMGSDPKHDRETKGGWFPNEQPQRTVALPSYEIARFPVTVAEYACFVHTGYPEPIWGWRRQMDKLDNPVCSVTWLDALAYSAWLAELTGQVWQLPTEAEWEKAARSTDGRIYPWGDVFDTSRCNTYESGLKATTPVGSYPVGASPYGAQDMVGNVKEWTDSSYIPYAVRMRADAESREERVLRGGSWRDNAVHVRAAYRPSNRSDFVGEDIGFRLVRELPGHAPQRVGVLDAPST